MQDEPSLQDIQLQLRAVERTARIASQEAQRTARRMYQNELTLTPWQSEEETDVSHYWGEFEHLLAQPEVKDMIADQIITKIFDGRGVEITMEIYQTSKAHRVLQQLVEIVKRERIGIRITHAAGVAIENIKRLPNIAFDDLKAEFHELQISTDDFLKSTIPKTLEHLNFDHRCRAMNRNELVLARGSLHKIENEGSVDYEVMCVSLAGKVQMEDSTVWDMTERMQRVKANMEQIVGFPYMMDVELSDEILAPVAPEKTWTQRAGNSEGKSNKKGKGKGKEGKGKGGKAGKNWKK